MINSSGQRGGICPFCMRWKRWPCAREMKCGHLSERVTLPRWCVSLVNLASGQSSGSGNIKELDRVVKVTQPHPKYYSRLLSRRSLQLASQILGVWAASLENKV